MIGRWFLFGCFLGWVIAVGITETIVRALHANVWVAGGVGLVAGAALAVIGGRWGMSRDERGREDRRR